MNAESWSKHSTSYNGPSGDPLTLAMVKSAFEAIWFPKLDKLIIDKKRDLPLKVLALACGTGAEIEILCSRYDKSQVSILATDYADGMVQMTQNCVERLGKQDMVTTKVMDAMNIDQEPSSFDVVFLVLGPMLMPDPNKVFQEIQRVLIPAGWSGYLTPGKMEIHDIMSQSRKEILDSCNRGDEFMHMYDSDMMKHWGTPDAVKARLEDAKFNAVESVLVQSSLDIQRGAQVDKTLNFLFENPGMAQMYEKGLDSQQAEQLRVSVRAAVHKKWPASNQDSSLQASLYMTANAAIGSI